jgi:Mg2+ and Co2+ transporter CorA
MDNKHHDKAPLFKNWGYWYALLIGVLILLILFFYLLTKHFS